MIAVIGAGTMGNGIAHLFAQYGFTTNLIDVSEESLSRALTTISKNLDRQVTKEIISAEIKIKTLANIKTFTSLADGVKDAELVVEAATENIDLKLKLFTQMDESAPA
ncbi:MAG: 3-hydroxyacyl-CoA dehydrogenase NAD-binding domain-containing protein, partial [Chitinophagaceae bacterium]